MRRLTRKEKEELVKKLYEKGYTYREIAKELRISVRDISRILRQEERKDEIDKIKEQLEELNDRVSRLWSRTTNILLILLRAVVELSVNIRCPNCGKVIRVAVREIEIDGEVGNVYVCPWCSSNLLDI